MMTYIDQMYGVYYSEQVLYHHGVKGQKWGVRRYQNPDGTRTDAGKKRASEKTGDKIAKLQAKIDKSDSNPILRRTINDNRRGKLEVLQSKQKWQKAKEDYKDAKKIYKTDKTAANKKSLRKARRNVHNSANQYSFDKDTHKKLSNRMFYGSFNRYKANGDSFGKALTKSTGVGLVTAAAVVGVQRGGVAAAKKVGNMAVDAILNQAVKNQQMAHIPRLPEGMITNFKYEVL